MNIINFDDSQVPATSPASVLTMNYLHNRKVIVLLKLLPLMVVVVSVSLLIQPWAVVDAFITNEDPEGRLIGASELIPIKYR